MASLGNKENYRTEKLHHSAVKAKITDGKITKVVHVTRVQHYRLVGLLPKLIIIFFS